MRAALLFTSLVAVAGLSACTHDAGTADTSGTLPRPSQVTTQSPSTAPPSASQPGIAPGEPAPNGKPSGTPSAPVTLSPQGEPVVPPGVEQVPAAQVDASALPTYYKLHGDVWVFDDGYSLEMFAAASSGCTDAEAVVVSQSSSEIKLTLRPLDSQPGGRPDGGGACTAVMTPKPVTVRLDQPLGDRMIYLGIGR
jgi:hypothetical protein